MTFNAYPEVAPHDVPARLQRAWIEINDARHTALVAPRLKTLRCWSIAQNLHCMGSNRTYIRPSHPLHAWERGQRTHVLRLVPAVLQPWAAILIIPPGRRFIRLTCNHATMQGGRCMSDRCPGGGGGEYEFHNPSGSNTRLEAPLDI